MADEPWDMTVGVIVGAHGLRGELRVRPETDEPERFAELDEVRLVDAQGEQRRARVVGSRPHARGLLVRLAEVTDRTEAEKLRGCAINIRRSMALPLAPDEYYVDQIVGLLVETVDGEEIGRVSEVLRTGANDVYVTPRGLVPAIGDVVKHIDVEAGRIVIEPLEGLFAPQPAGRRGPGKCT
ncbi:MAG: ribosome maturation factor RimM [Armatimonadota bacterium]